MMPYTLGKVNDILVNFEEILDFLGILMIGEMRKFESLPSNFLQLEHEWADYYWLIFYLAPGDSYVGTTPIKYNIIVQIIVTTLITTTASIVGES